MIIFCHFKPLVRLAIFFVASWGVSNIGFCLKSNRPIKISLSKSPKHIVKFRLACLRNKPFHDQTILPKKPLFSVIFLYFEFFIGLCLGRTKEFLLKPTAEVKNILILFMQIIREGGCRRSQFKLHHSFHRTAIWPFLAFYKR